MNKVKKTKERRIKKRWQVAVLVRCSLPKFSDDIFELEMWAKDVNEKGMLLEYARGLNVHKIHKDPDEEQSQPIRFEDIQFSKGEPIKVQDLFYDDDGSPFIDGKIAWTKKTSSGNCSIGIQFLDAKKQPKALLGAFKDFLSIVKNPTVAIRKASRKS